MLLEKYLPKLLWNSGTNGLRPKLITHFNCDLTLQHTYESFNARDKKRY